MPAVNRLRYGRELEKQLGKGKGIEKSQKRAVKKSAVKKKPAKKKSLFEKTKRRVKELLGGSKTYSKKRYGPAKNEWVDKTYGESKKRVVAKPKKKKFKTTRTAAIEKRLRSAGLTDKEISGLRGK